MIKWIFLFFFSCTFKYCDLIFNLDIFICINFFYNYNIFVLKNKYDIVRNKINIEIMIDKQVNGKYIIVINVEIFFV